jgi:hypothetical protein
VKVRGAMREWREDEGRCPTYFIGSGCRPTVTSTPALTTSRFPHALNVWRLPHSIERFLLLVEIEAPWVSTGVN